MTHQLLVENNLYEWSSDIELPRAYLKEQRESGFADDIGLLLVPFRLVPKVIHAIGLTAL